MWNVESVPEQLHTTSLSTLFSKSMAAFLSSMALVVQKRLTFTGLSFIIFILLAKLCCASHWVVLWPFSYPVAARQIQHFRFQSRTYTQTLWSYYIEYGMRLQCKVASSIKLLITLFKTSAITIKLLSEWKQSYLAVNSNRLFPSCQGLCKKKLFKSLSHALTCGIKHMSWN